MDAREWGQHNADFLDVLGDVCLPQPERVNCRLSAAAGDLFQLDTIEAVGWHGAAYTVFECEVGSYRMRAGRCLQRTVIALSGGSDTVQVVGSHGYLAGDGPIRVSASVVITAPTSLQFLQVGAGNDKIIRSSGSWLADGFSATAAVTVGGTIANNGVFTPVAISTTTNANDTLEFAGDVFTNEMAATPTAYVNRGALPGIDMRADYWVEPVSNSLIQLFRSRAEALVGTNPINITGASLGAHRVGPNMGPYRAPGWTASFPTRPPAASTVDGEGEKLLRTGERIAVSGGAATFMANENNSVLKWWSVG